MYDGLVATETGSTPPPRVEDVNRICAVADPVRRNLQITQCYHELALAIANRTGAGANWCLFAAWASRQAGCTIRGEDLFATFEQRLARISALTSPAQALWRKLLRAGLYNPETRLGRFARQVQSPLDALERASDAVARGNKKVFEEIGREFARFLATPPGDAAFANFLDGLRPGDPPAGQRYLRAAFTHYSQASVEPGPKKRAELMLLANLEIGLHEQTRLQPEILEALNSPVDEAHETGHQFLSVAFPDSKTWWGWTRRPAAGAADNVAQGLRQFTRRLVRLTVTDHLMTLTVPVKRVLRLGRDLNAPFAESLRELSHADLLALAARFDGPSAAVEDWAVLEERMRYISRLFRAFHEDAHLCDPPFNERQTAQIRQGVLPDGGL